MKYVVAIKTVNGLKNEAYQSAGNRRSLRAEERSRLELNTNLITKARTKLKSLGMQDPVAPATMITDTDIYSVELTEAQAEELRQSLGDNAEIVPDDDAVGFPEAIFDDVSIQAENYDPEIAASTAAVGDQFAYLDTGSGGPLMDGRAAIMPSIINSKVLFFVIDTGADAEHENLRTVIDAGRSQTFLNDKPEPGGTKDPNGHGTLVADIAHRYAPGANIISYQIFDMWGTTSWSRAHLAFRHARDTAIKEGKAAVINMSLSGSKYQALNKEINQAIANNIVAVAATNNSARDSCEFSPASANKAISVAGTSDGNTVMSAFSGHGPCADVYAPSEGITGAQANTKNGQITKKGVSFGTPQVAGKVWSMLASDPKLKGSQVERELSKIFPKFGDFGYSQNGKMVNNKWCLTAIPKKALIFQGDNRVSDEISTSYETKYISKKLFFKDPVINQPIAFGFHINTLFNRGILDLRFATEHADLSSWKTTPAACKDEDLRVYGLKLLLNDRKLELSINGVVNSNLSRSLTDEENTAIDTLLKLPMEKRNLWTSVTKTNNEVEIHLGHGTRIGEKSIFTMPLKIDISGEKATVRKNGLRAIYVNMPSLTTDTITIGDPVVGGVPITSSPTPPTSHPITITDSPTPPTLVPTSPTLAPPPSSEPIKPPPTQQPTKKSKGNKKGNNSNTALGALDTTASNSVEEQGNTARYYISLKTPELIESEYAADEDGDEEHGRFLRTKHETKKINKRIYARKAHRLELLKKIREHKYKNDRRALQGDTDVRPDLAATMSWDKDIYGLDLTEQEYKEFQDFLKDEGEIEKSTIVSIPELVTPFVNNSSSQNITADISTAATDTLPPWNFDSMEYPADGQYRVPAAINTNRVVGVIFDTGADMKHPNFKNVVFLTQFCRDFSGGSESTTGYDRDLNGHGTHVTDIFSMNAPGIPLIIIKVLPDFGYGSAMNVIKGLRYARDLAIKQGFTIVDNLSLVGAKNKLFDTEINNSHSTGKVINVCAAGNSGEPVRYYSPASATSAFTVGGTAANNLQIYADSNFGDEVKVWAPATLISAAKANSSGTTLMQGTSQATPAVAGKIAMQAAQNPDATNTDIETAFINSQTVNYKDIGYSQNDKIKENPSCKGARIPRDGKILQTLGLPELNTVKTSYGQMWFTNSKLYFEDAIKQNEKLAFACKYSQILPTSTISVSFGTEVLSNRVDWRNSACKDSDIRLYNIEINLITSSANVVVITDKTIQRYPANILTTAQRNKLLNSNGNIWATVTKNQDKVRMSFGSGNIIGANQILKQEIDTTSDTLISRESGIRVAQADISGAVQTVTITRVARDETTISPTASVSQPTSNPTTWPTLHSTGQPTWQPTGLPTGGQPSTQPTSFAPSTPQPVVDTESPTTKTKKPTREPTGRPTRRPTIPTREPTDRPTRFPTEPTPEPTYLPTYEPTLIPTDPTGSPVLPPVYLPPHSHSPTTAAIGDDQNSDVVTGVATAFGLLLAAAFVFPVARFLIKKYNASTNANNNVSSREVSTNVAQTPAVAVDTPAPPTRSTAPIRNVATNSNVASTNTAPRAQAAANTAASANTAPRRATASTQPRSQQLTTANPPSAPFVPAHAARNAAAHNAQQAVKHNKRKNTGNVTPTSSTTRSTNDVAGLTVKQRIAKIEANNAQEGQQPPNKKKPDTSKQ